MGPDAQSCVKGKDKTVTAPHGISFIFLHSIDQKGYRSCDLVILKNVKAYAYFLERQAELTLKTVHL